MNGRIAAAALLAAITLTATGCSTAVDPPGLPAMAGQWVGENRAGLQIELDGKISAGRLPTAVVDTAEKASKSTEAVVGKILIPQGDDAHLNSRFPAVLVIVQGLPGHPKGLALTAEYHPGNPAKLVLSQGDIESGGRFVLSKSHD